MLYYNVLGMFRIFCHIAGVVVSDIACIIVCGVEYTVVCDIACIVLCDIACIVLCDIACIVLCDIACIVVCDIVGICVWHCRPWDITGTVMWYCRQYWERYCRYSVWHCRCSDIAVIHVYDNRTLNHMHCYVWYCRHCVVLCDVAGIVVSGIACTRAGQDQGGPFQQHYVTSLSQG